MPNIDDIRGYLTAAIGRQVFPGCALGWVIDGKTSIITAGNHTYDVDSERVTETSLFDCASVTKSIPVSTLALWMIDRGKLSIDNRLIDFVPEYTGSYRKDITVKHLLTHTLDFDFRLSEFKDLAPEELLGAIISVKMKGPPGEKFCYANATSILLGMVLESAGAKSLQILAKEIFFDPLEMQDTTFFPAENAIKNCVPTEDDPWRGRVIQGEVHDESAWALRGIMTAGSAGMFSTVGDLLKFVGMLVGGDSGRTTETTAPARSSFFKPETVQAMYTNQIPHIDGQCTGLGWELNQPYMGTNRTPATIGKTGFTGATVIMDIPRKSGLVLLSNYTWPTRKPNRDMINEVRAGLADLIFA
ncbi:MAG: beta-lactamase family protein [Chitinispirillia bacterium]|nr:beta-lactamase family protein [Chitinispirillia bacterium]